MIKFVFPHDVVIAQEERTRFKIIPAKGDPGPGVPAGGTLKQALRKVSATDYDTEWADPEVTAEQFAALEEYVRDMSPVKTIGPAAIASVSDAAPLSAEQVVVGIEPVQDLHGYDNPWPAGGGKNLFNKAAVTDNAWIDDQGVEHSVSGYWLSDYIPVTAGETYFRPQTGSGRNAYYASDKSFVAYVMSQNTALVAPSNAAYFRFVGTGTTYNDNIQFEKGSTATSYVPYSNVCPITGWTGAQVTRTGVNVWDEEWVRGTVDWNTRKITPDAQGARICSKNFIPVKSGGTYYINYQHFGNAVFGYADEYANGVDISVPDSTKLCTIPAGIQFIKFAASISDYGSDTYQNDISINYPATDTQYHPYTGNQISVTFPSEAGTVYGGTLDVTNGVLTVDRAMVDLGTLAWYEGDYNIFHSMVADMAAATTYDDRKTGIMSSAYKISTRISLNQNMDDQSMLRADRNINVRDTAYSDATTFTAAMSGVQLVYELATPVTYDLTAEQVALLLRNNTIWTDTGDTTLTYRADIPEYIDQRINATRSMIAGIEAAMTATKTYSAGDLLIVGDTLYKATTSIANGATLTPGTNVTATTVAEQLILLANA